MAEFRMRRLPFCAMLLVKRRSPSHGDNAANHAFFGIRQKRGWLLRGRIAVHDRHLSVPQHRAHSTRARSRAPCLRCSVFRRVHTRTRLPRGIVTARFPRLRALSSTTSSRFPAKIPPSPSIHDTSLCRKKQLNQYARRSSDMNSGLARELRSRLRPFALKKLDIRPVVGGQDDNRGIAANQPADAARPQDRSDRVSSSR